MGFNPTVNLRFLDAKKGSRESSPCRRPAKAWRSMEEEDEPIESRAERVARLKAMIAAHSGGDGGSGGAAPGEGPATGKLINPLVDGSFGPSGVDIDPTAIHGKPIPARLLPYTTSPEIAPPENAASRMVHDRIFKASQQHGQQPPQPGLHPGPFPPPPPPPQQLASGIGGDSGAGPPPAQWRLPAVTASSADVGGHFGGGRGGAGGGGRGGNRGVKRDRGVDGRDCGQDGATMIRALRQEVHGGGSLGAPRGGHRRRDGGSSEGEAAHRQGAGPSWIRSDTGCSIPRT